MTRNKENVKCEHCYDQRYVFVYWFERVLDQNGIHLTDIPAELFEKIPIELIVHCHCNIALLLPSNIDKGPNRCLECDGMTWRFTESAEQSGYRWKKIINLQPPELKDLPCDYFERCACGYDEQAPRPPEKRKVAKEALDFLRIKIPRIGFSFFQRLFCLS